MDVKIRYFAILVIACLQACSAASRSEESSAQPLKGIATSNCQYYLPHQVPGAQHEHVYRWTDTDGNVHYGDSIPPEYAEPPMDPKQVIAVAQELQEQVDQLLFEAYLLKPEDRDLMQGDRRAEILSEQAHATELKLRNLERRLAALEVAEEIPECKELLRQKILVVHYSIEKLGQEPEYYRDDIERIQDIPEQLRNGDEDGRVAVD
jgi:hypothetical protein